ncbi:MAG: oligosaccharide flippase family protein [Proteobacteria bacterium]|nr:oligosaccharide flippase family protein [Pseudomonadota bacterium]
MADVGRVALGACPTGSPVYIPLHRVTQISAFRPIESLSSTRTLVSGMAWIGIGRGLPVLVALGTTPFLLHRLEVDRWALYTLALSIAGSFGILDLGMSAALTRALAERIGTSEERDAAPLIIAGLTVLMVVGLAGAVLGAWFAPTLIDHLLTVPTALRSEAIAAFRVLALAAPLIVISGALWGVLSAYQNFRAATLINIPVNAVYYVGPVFAMLIGGGLIGVIATLVAARLLQTMLSAALVLRLVPQLADRPRIELRRLRSLLRIGLWVTVSNTLWPVMLYVDRFIVGAALTLAEVSYYSTPLDLVLRLLIVPISVAAVLFPAVATSHRDRPDRAASLLGTGSAVALSVVFLPCVLLAAFADTLLSLWLGKPFAGQSAFVLTVMAVGMFLNCAALLPSTFTDAIGRPELGGITILAQVVLFPPIVYIMAVRYGIGGAALAWSARAAANCAVRLLICRRLGPRAAPVVPGLAVVTALGVAAIVACALIGPVPARAGAAAVACVAIPAAAAALLLDADTQAALRRRLARIGRIARGAPLQPRIRHPHG